MAGEDGKHIDAFEASNERRSKASKAHILCKGNFAFGAPEIIQTMARQVQNSPRTQAVLIDRLSLALNIDCIIVRHNSSVPCKSEPNIVPEHIILTP